MSSATFTPASLSSGPAGPRPAAGATALSGDHRPHRVGTALRAAKVFMGTAFGVAVLGEFAEEAGVRRR
ncbi:hypothetical protein [Streptomyces silvensis]|uniref:Uncharacterized protein n=1 Tax=Streptomyces silvensis TaxID=1765722 RepID=A0A0W7X9X1_9ACTN|nr:hypothetical protein [Streptomyces silvensis]KUF19766.1 hypothetical protein AT728_05310 [Streptomyces silvensis]